VPVAGGNVYESVLPAARETGAVSGRGPAGVGEHGISREPPGWPAWQDLTL
jgi:hypothetical protein